MSKTGLKWVLVIFIVGLTARPALLVEASDENQLFERMSQAWTTVNTRFYHPGTSQYYTAEPSLLPSPEQIQLLNPDDCGYGTGMDDVPLFGGPLLVSIIDQYDVAQNDSLKADAAKIFKGLELTATVHGIPGFVARGISPEDGESFYICSSRDQYTNLVHGLWRYYHSPLSDEAAKSSIREILPAIADRMTRNVTPANNYDFLRADDTRDVRGICRMWDVYCHEMARLPMLYAAAWDVGQNEEHYNLYRQYLPEAIQDSLALPDLPSSETAWRIPPYAVLQMQNSLELLHGLEQEPEMKSQIRQAMLQVAEFTETKLQTTHRQTGELALAQLMSEDYVFTQQHRTKLVGAIMATNYDADPEAAYVLQGAYWKAVRSGAIAEGEASAGLPIEESFNYDKTSWDLVVGSNNNVIVTGLDGGTGFATDSQWGVCLQSTTPGIEGNLSIVDGLTFSGLATSGNALFTENLDNSALASRAIGVTVPTGTTVWTSYLWSQTNPPVSDFSAAYSQLTSSQFGTTNRRLRILPNQYGSSTTSSISDGSTTHNLTIPTLQDGDTYLMVAKNSNIGQTGTGTLWVMAESAFAICTADGTVTEQELNENCVGTVTGNLGVNTITSGAFLQLAHVWGAGTFDEFRMGTTLAAVIPFAAIIPGDANSDGKVDSSDASILAQHWLQQSGATWADGDFNRDGAVNDIDATILAANWQVTAIQASVPEPSMLLLLGIGGLAMLFSGIDRSHMITNANNSTNQRSITVSKRGLRSVLLVFILGLMAQPGLSAELGKGKQSNQNDTKTGAVLVQNQKLSERMSDAWKTINTRFYDPGTSQFYTAEPSLLPSAEKVKCQDPNDCGYGTGMDDVPLFGGTLLVAICDQYDVTHKDSLKADAAAVFNGLKLCATVHGIPGFVARGVCPEDGKSIYITSSRDQYTHLVHGFWRYYHSPLCDEAAKLAIREILPAVADRMTRNVTPENNYDFLRADGSQDPRGICRMLNVFPHEAARLAMFYAAAWDVGRDEEHYCLYRKHLPQAIQGSLDLPNLSEKQVASLIPPYSVLQMQCSLEVLHDLERDPEIKSQIGKAMLMATELTARKRNPTFRHCGELALAQLMSKDFTFTQQHKTKLAGAIMGAKYDVDPAAAYCLLGAYWKALRSGVFEKENKNKRLALVQ